MFKKGSDFSNKYAYDKLGDTEAKFLLALKNQEVIGMFNYNATAERETLKRIEELQVKVNKVIEQNNKLLDMLFEIDRKTLKPKLKEIADAERRW